MSPQRTDLAASVLSRRACSALSELIETLTPLVRHQPGVAGDRVFRFDLVAPPVGERGRAGAVRRDFLRDLVALEHVLERRDLEAHLVGDADHHQNLVRAVRVTVDEPFAFENLDERVELQIAFGRQHVGVLRLLRLVVLPRLLVHLRARERVAHDVLHALARRRIPPRSGTGLLTRPLHVFAERELDAGQRAFEHQIFAPRLAPPQLDDDGLAADRVGAAVQDVRHREPAGEVAIDADVGRIEHVAHPGHRAHGRRALVDRVVGDVRVGVDDARRDELAGAVIDVGARRNRRVGADGGDLAVAHDDGAVGNRAACDGHDRRVSDGGNAGLRGLPVDLRRKQRVDRHHGRDNGGRDEREVDAGIAMPRRPPGAERRDCNRLLKNRARHASKNLHSPAPNPP